MPSLRQKLIFGLSTRLKQTSLARQIDFLFDRLPHLEYLRPHEVQHRLWTSPARIKLVAAGRGSGKTELAKRWLVQQLGVPKPWPNPRYFYAAPTLTQAKRIAWNDLKAFVPKSWVASPDDIREGSLTIKTIFGSTVQILGLDKPQRIEGVQWDGAVIDESCDVKPGTVDLSVIPALTHRSGRLWRIGVPKRTGIGANEFKSKCMAAERGEEYDTEYFTWKSSTVLTPEQLEYARRTLDMKDFNEQFNASWETAGGGVFYAFDEQQNVRPCAYFSEKPLYIGSDFNVDPMCWIIGHKHDRCFEVIDELFVRDTNTQACLNMLASRYSTHTGGFRFYGDASGRARRSSAASTDYQLICDHPKFQDLGRTVHYASANPLISRRLAATNAVLCNAANERRLFIDPRCKHLIQDLSARHYKDGTTDLNDVGDLGHITDALSYVIYALYPIRYKAKGSYDVSIELVGV